MAAEQKKEIIVGVRLTREYVELAYFHHDMPEPELIENSADNSNRWPLSIGYRRENGKWLYLPDIKKTKSESLYVIKDKLIDLLEKQEPVEVADEFITPDVILSNCLSQLLDELFVETEKYSISFITFSFDKLSESLICDLKTILEKLDKHGASWSFQDDLESYYDFAVRQSRELWTNDVVYIQQIGKKLRAISLTNAVYPHEKALTSKETMFDDFYFDEESERKDKELCSILTKFFERRVVSCVFLEGEVFGKSWLSETLKFLCRNRRVFGVENLLVKGACYHGKRKRPGELRSKYYMGENQLKYHIGVIVLNEGREEYCRMIWAGTSWYEADFKWDFMVCDTDVVHIQTDPAINGVPRYIDLDISWIVHRPLYATKIEISLHFAGVNRWYAQVTDLGLGDMYPSEEKSVIEYVGEW